jgi:hypothetical protein
VMFNGVTAQPTTWTASSIVVRVPSGATSGDVVVTVGGVASNGVTFTVTPIPSITSLSPSSGTAGTSVTIAGVNFGSTPGTVTFNGVAAGVTSWSPTSIVTSIPVGVATGQFVVSVGGLASTGVQFTVLAPVISTLQPPSGLPGQQTIVNGSNFGPCACPATVAINGTPATIVSWSSTKITALIPPGATSGNLVVTVGGLASNGMAFSVETPFISSLSTTSGNVGAPVTINGSQWFTSNLPR